MNKKLLLISDLWGQADWMDSYASKLERNYEVRMYDAQILAGIDGKYLDQEKLHQEFVKGGIDHAASELCRKNSGRVDILAFSVGGAIAWEAILRGLKVGKLVAISSTRLRYEEEKPNCEIGILFGENDRYKPGADWLKRMELKENLVNGEGHEFYREEKGWEHILPLLPL